MPMKFEDWFYEQEGFALRAERFYDDLERGGNGLTREEAITAVGWLRAAYKEGYDQARYDTMKIFWDDGK